jgi:hypothetical protein
MRPCRSPADCAWGFARSPLLRVDERLSTLFGFFIWAFSPLDRAHGPDSLFCSLERRNRAGAKIGSLAGVCEFLTIADFGPNGGGQFVARVWALQCNRLFVSDCIASPFICLHVAMFYSIRTRHTPRRTSSRAPLFRSRWWSVRQPAPVPTAALVPRTSLSAVPRIPLRCQAPAGS